jgi:hypothetical protein
MRSLESRLMIEDGLSLDDTVPSLFVIEGDITWPADEHNRYPRLTVKKVLVRDAESRVSGKLYVYQACVCTEAKTYEVFRYDNVHPHPGHADNYHAHWLCDGPEEVVWIGQQHWPHLSDVIECLDTWWKEDGQNRQWR